MYFYSKHSEKGEVIQTASNFPFFHNGFNCIASNLASGQVYQFFYSNVFTVDYSETNISIVKQ